MDDGHELKVRYEGTNENCLLAYDYIPGPGRALKSIENLLQSDHVRDEFDK